MLALIKNIFSNMGDLIDSFKVFFSSTKKIKMKTVRSLKRLSERYTDNLNENKRNKIRPGINKHDYEVKVKAFQKFIKGGNKVKVSMRFRGREMEHQNLGVDLLKKLIEQVKEYATVEVPPKNEGKQIMMVLVPFNEK